MNFNVKIEENRTEFYSNETENEREGEKMNERTKMAAFVCRSTFRLDIRTRDARGQHILF